MRWLVAHHTVQNTTSCYLTIPLRFENVQVMSKKDKPRMRQMSAVSTAHMKYFYTHTHTHTHTHRCLAILTYKHSWCSLSLSPSPYPNHPPTPIINEIAQVFSYYQTVDPHQSFYFSFWLHINTSKTVPTDNLTFLLRIYDKEATMLVKN